MPGFDAVVLAGGAASRLGGVDKPMISVRGVPMLLRVLDAVRNAGLRVVVGPARAGVTGVRWARERPPGGGPVAGLAAGLPLTRSDLVFVLAADQPWIGGAIGPLLAALEVTPRADAALLRADGRANPLAALWRRPALTEALERLPRAENAAMRALLSGVTTAAVEDAGGWSADYDTWRDLVEIDE